MLVPFLSETGDYAATKTGLRSNGGVNIDRKTIWFWTCQGGGKNLQIVMFNSGNEGANSE